MLCQAQKEKIESQSDELINLRALKVEHEAKLSYSVDTIKVLEQSNAQKALSITELEAKLTAAY